MAEAGMSAIFLLRPHVVAHTWGRLFASFEPTYYTFILSP
jgi:hypothetical protein